MSTKLNAKGTPCLYRPKGAQPMRAYILETTALGRITIARQTGRWNSKAHNWIIDNVWPDTLEEVAQPIADERDELREALVAMCEAMEHRNYGIRSPEQWATEDYKQARAILAKYPKP
jgi:hypothetical protein